MHSTGGPSAPRAATPLGGLAVAEASTAVVAKDAGCTSRLTAAALGALVSFGGPPLRGFGYKKKKKLLGPPETPGKHMRADDFLYSQKN